MIGGLWRRIRAVALTDVGALVTGNRTELLERLERVLVEADFGPAAYEVLDALEAELPRREWRSADAVRRWPAERIAGLVGDGADPGRLNLGDGAGPGVIVLLGVNGVGKTTQIAKLAHRLGREGRRVLLAQADTYPAGAGEQLRAGAGRPRRNPAGRCNECRPAKETYGRPTSGARRSSSLDRDRRRPAGSGRRTLSREA